MATTEAPQETVSMPRLMIDDRPLSWKEILGGMQLFGKLQPFLQEVVGQYVLIQEMGSRDELTVTSSEMMEAIMDFRIQQQLNDQEKFEAWLQNEGLNNSTFQQRISMGLRLKKLKTAIAAPGLQTYFEENKDSLERLKVKCLVASEESLARQFKERVQSGENMMALSNEQAISDSSAKANYFQQTVQRRALTAELSEALTGVAAGNLVGPVKAGEGWAVCRVEEILPAELDAKLQAQIEAQLFAEWLLEKTKGLKISFDLQNEDLSAVES